VFCSKRTQTEDIWEDGAEEVTRGWKELCSGIPVIRTFCQVLLELLCIRWIEYVAGVGEMVKCMQGIGDKTLKEGDYFEDLDIDGRRMLRQILKECDVMTLTGLIWLKIGIRVGLS
jgi:hypothetical protein